MSLAPTRIRNEVLALPMAHLGPPSTLPRFRWQQPMPRRQTPSNFGLTAAESLNGFNWGEASILPYQVYDDYDRELRPGKLDCLVLENGHLQAVIAPRLGGRLIALKDLASGRDLVFSNPVFQPANLGALNAWFSGGIEWNGLIPGHTPFTCAPVFAGVRNTAQGPILRLYEFDRIAEASWQIDLFMPAGSARLFAHGRIVNPASQARLAYWWTNIAVPMAPGTRVLSPADYSVEHIWPGNNLGRCEFPRADWDAASPANWENSTSVFFRSPDAPRPFIMALDAKGFGLAQTSTRAMAGRKFFYFGSAPGGQHWLDHLSRPGEGNYLEIQSGITPTQNQRFALAGGEERDWTEAFAPVGLDPVKAHEADYRAAVAGAAEALDAAVPADELAQMDAFLRAEARLPLDTRYASGAPWGARHEQLVGQPLAAGLDFSVPVRGDFWDDLAQDRPISEKNLASVPDTIAVSTLWLDRLTASAEAHGTSWLHALMLAVALLDRGDRDAAKVQIEHSLAIRPSWLGYRLQALISPAVETASQNYRAAWATGDAPPELAVEIANHFMTAGRAADLKQFVDALPAPVRDNERIVLARAMVAANAHQFDELERLLLSRPFASIREGETLLSDLWVRLRRGRLQAQLHRPPTPEEARADLARHPLPRALDLRMHRLDETETATGDGA